MSISIPLVSKKTYTETWEAVSDYLGIPTSKFEMICEKGVGNEGVYAYKNKVYKVTDYLSEITVCKRLLGHSFKNVVKIHNIAKFYLVSDFAKTGRYMMYIVEMERLMPDPSFDFDSINVEKFLRKQVRKRAALVREIMRGLEELASVGIQYHDLHSDNVMVDKRGNRKIIDFGFCKSLRRASFMNT